MVGLLGMELNSYSYLALLYFSVDTKESALKYFFVQVLGSQIFLLGIFLDGPVSYGFIIFSLCLKIGLVPFHLWIISFIEDLLWENVFLNFRLTKIGPLYIFYILASESDLMFFAVLCTIVGLAGGLNQLDIRKFMVYSSISQYGWIFFRGIVGGEYFAVFVLNYNILLFLLITQINFLGLNSLRINVSLYKKLNLDSFYIYLYNFIGLPPSLSFFLKLVVISLSLRESLIFGGIFFIFVSVVTLYFYSRLVWEGYVFMGGLTGFSFSYVFLLLTIRGLFFVLAV